MQRQFEWHNIRTKLIEKEVKHLQKFERRNKETHAEKRNKLYWYLYVGVNLRWSVAAAQWTE